MRVKLSTAVHESRAVAGVRRLLAGSLARRAAAGAAANRHDETRALAVASGSALLTACEAVIDSAAASVEGSSFRRWLAAALGPFEALATWQRVRLAGWTLLIALASRILVLALAQPPVHIRRGTVAGWSITLAAALLLMVAPRVFAAAWRERRWARFAS